MLEYNEACDLNKNKQLREAIIKVLLKLDTTLKNNNLVLSFYINEAGGLIIHLRQNRQRHKKIFNYKAYCQTAEGFIQEIKGYLLDCLTEAGND